MDITLAIVGRPNVGKSTLFNRLAGKRIAIADNTIGVTRDRRIASGSISDLELEIIDTAGFEDGGKGNLKEKIREQTKNAIKEADLALFIVDARSGIVPLDKFLAKWLRTQKIPIILLANKCEGRTTQLGIYEAFELGLGDPIPISAEHGEGLAELYQALLPYTQKIIPDTNHTDRVIENVEASKQIHIAIVGRPNVGKSTLINYLIGEDRLLTGPESGITRDAIAIEWEQNGRSLKLIDTAGLRRKSKIQDKVERLSATESFRAIQYAQIVILLLDGNFMLEKQDLRIARQIIDEGRILIVAVNKWDIVKNKKQAIQKLDDRLRTSLPQVKGIPIIQLSALTGENIDKLLPTAFETYDIWNQRISTGKLNNWLMMMIERHPPPLKNGRRIRIRYITQAKTRPPTFVVFSSKGNDLPESYRRFLVNGIRTDFNLPGIPIRILVRKGDNPYVKQKIGT